MARKAIARRQPPRQRQGEHHEGERARPELPTPIEGKGTTTSDEEENEGNAYSFTLDTVEGREEREEARTESYSKLDNERSENSVIRARLVNNERAILSWLQWIEQLRWKVEMLEEVDRRSMGLGLCAIEERVCEIADTCTWAMDRLEANVAEVQKENKEANRVASCKASDAMRLQEEVRARERDILERERETAFLCTRPSRASRATMTLPGPRRVDRAVATSPGPRSVDRAASPLPGPWTEDGVALPLRGPHREDRATSPVRWPGPVSGEVTGPVAPPKEGGASSPARWPSTSCRRKAAVGAGAPESAAPSPSPGQSGSEEGMEW